MDTSMGDLLCKALDFLLPEASEIKKNWTDIAKLLEE
jgi:hypothetical protein